MHALHEPCKKSQYKISQHLFWPVLHLCEGWKLKCWATELQEVCLQVISAYPWLGRTANDQQRARNFKFCSTKHSRRLIQMLVDAPQKNELWPLRCPASCPSLLDVVHSSTWVPAVTGEDFLLSITSVVESQIMLMRHAFLMPNFNFKLTPPSLVLSSPNCCRKLSFTTFFT